MYLQIPGLDSASSTLGRAPARPCREVPVNMRKKQTLVAESACDVSTSSGRKAADMAPTLGLRELTERLCVLYRRAHLC